MPAQQVRIDHPLLCSLGAFYGGCVTTDSTSRVRRAVCLMNGIPPVFANERVVAKSGGRIEYV